MSSNINQTYNGWSNRETWLASTWLNSDSWGHSIIVTLNRCYANADSYDKAEWLELAVRESYEDELQRSDLCTDLLNTAVNRINWYEIVTNNEEIV